MPSTPKRKRLVGPMSRRLRSARTNAGLSKSQLAALIGISLRAVNYYEDPQYGRARKSYIVKAWAEACGYEFEDIWGRGQQGIARTGWVSQIPA